jgi:hypothetical protein
VVTAKVWAKGRHGGTDIKSAPFVFPVDVCTGCLQMSYSSGNLAAYRYPADTPFCEHAWGDASNYQGDGCFYPGQDKPIFCCAITSTINDVATDVILCPGQPSGKDPSTNPDAGP